MLDRVVLGCQRERLLNLVGRRTYTDEQLLDAARTCHTMRDIIATQGLVPRGGNYETVRRRIAVLGLDVPELRKLTRGRPLSACSKEEAAKALRSSRSLAQVLGKLEVRPGGNQARVRDLIQEMGLDTTHLVGKGWRRGTTAPPVPARPIEELLVDGRFAETNRLKKRLIDEGLKGSTCEMCARAPGTGTPSPWNWITSMGGATIIGWLIFGFFAQTATLRQTPTEARTSEPGRAYSFSARVAKPGSRGGPKPRRPSGHVGSNPTPGTSRSGGT
jgi:hypothetical protein